MRRRHGVARALLVGVLTIAAAGCRGSGTSDPVGIGITGTRFDPDALDLPSGRTTFVIANNDPFAHTFTLDDGTVDRRIPAGETVHIVVDLTATVGFHCRIHPTSMHGTLTVG
jgi:plastocyanin